MNCQHEKKGSCHLVKELCGLPMAQCRTARAACHECTTLGRQRYNRVIQGLALRAVLHYAPDRPETIQKIRHYLRHKNTKKTEKETPGMSKTVVLNSDAHGIGDAMVMAWASEGAKKGPVRLIHKATGRTREVLEFFGQPVTDDGDGAVETFEAYGKELHEERGEVPRVISRAQYLGIHTKPRRPQLGELPDICEQWADEVVTSKRNDNKRSLVLLFPQTAYRSREWPPSYWIDLAWQLHNSGIGVTMLLSDDEDRYHNTPGYWYGYPWGNVIALMKKSDLVIGNDSGPVHIAGTLDITTLALMGPTKSTVFSHMPSVECLAANKNAIECVGCYFGPPYRASCDQGCQALYRLHVEAVLSCAVQKLSEKDES